jgi:antibiotic biosynthesis monooxygenase (ABM) superfamily enzyme
VASTQTLVGSCDTFCGEYRIHLDQEWLVGGYYLPRSTFHLIKDLYLVLLMSYILLDEVYTELLTHWLAHAEYLHTS